MTTFPGSPRVAKAGFVLVDPETGSVQRVIPLQYNPETLTRSLAIQGMGPDSGDRVDALRLKGPPVETLKVDAMLDATDQLAGPPGPLTRQGIAPQLAALELLVTPEARRLEADARLAARGVLEIAPIETALLLFTWGPGRVLPVRLTELSVTEELFSPSLFPLRARVSLGMRVLSGADLGNDHRGARIFLAHLREKERLRGLLRAPGLDLLGKPRIGP